MKKPSCLQNQNMHQIPTPNPQPLPQHIISDSPNPEMAHRLPQPRLKDIRRALLLRNDAYCWIPLPPISY